MASILLAEDDKNLANIFCKWLEDEGYNVSVAKNGIEGIKKIVDENVPDLLITDILMSGADGEALMLAFSSLAMGQPIIVVTACDESRLIDRLSGETSVKKILSKPISCEQLLFAVKNVLEGKVAQSR